MQPAARSANLRRSTSATAQAALAALAALAAISAGAAPARVWQTIDAGPAPTTGWSRMVQPGPAPVVRLLPANGATPAGETSGAAVAGAASSGLQAWRVTTEMQSAPGRAPGLTPLLSPFLSGGLPTGFAGRWGDYAISGSAATPGREREGQPDGSLNLGLSFGDPIRAVGLDVNWGIGSIKNFGANGGFSATLGRVLVNRPGLTVAVAGGVFDAVTYGFEPDVDNPATPYGAVSLVVPLQPDNPGFQRLLQLSAGGGGSLFAPMNEKFRTTANGGPFGAIGMELTRNLGASVGMSGRAANVSLSYIPLHDVPIFVNLLAADVFNNTPYGTIGVLTVGWGDNFRTGFFRN